MNKLTINMDKIIYFIKKLEGLRLKEYKDIAGVKTIGVGHTGHDVYEGMEITEEQADDLLKKDLTNVINGLNISLKTQLNENQSTAIISFVFNIGLGNFKKSTVFSLINQGNLKGGSEHMALWNKAGIYVSKGLEKRRQEEINLFNS